VALLSTYCINIKVTQKNIKNADFALSKVRQVAYSNKFKMDRHGRFKADNKIKSFEGL